MKADVRVRRRAKVVESVNCMVTEEYGLWNFKCDLPGTRDYS